MCTLCQGHIEKGYTLRRYAYGWPTLTNSNTIRKTFNKTQVDGDIGKYLVYKLVYELIHIQVLNAHRKIEWEKTI